jgi:quercetin dioxygenase-like cupin family protein
MPDYTLYPLQASPRVPFKFDGRILFSSEEYELVHLTLQPGEAMEKHTQPIPIVFFVAQGQGTLAVGEALIEVAEKTTIHVNAGVARAWTNIGDKPLVILVNKLLTK